MAPESIRPAASRVPGAMVLTMAVCALAIRLYLALASPYFWDEIYDWVVVSRSISFSAASLHLPIHDGQHPSLPAYFMRAGTLVLGDTPIGYRVPGVLVGTGTVALVYLFGRRWLGEASGIVAAALLSFNEYHIGISALATEKPYYLFFALAATWFFCEYYRTGRLRDACLSGCMLGLGTLCKYLTLLLLPVFSITVLLIGNRKRFHARAVWLSALIVVVIVLPDVLWNVSHGDTTGSSAANIGDHFQRIGGLGFSRQALVFYLRDIRNAVYPLVGLTWADPAAEYPAMNAIMGVALLGGMIALTMLLVLRGFGVRSRTWLAEPMPFVVVLLGLWFWLVLGFFMSIRQGTAKAGMDPVGWFWVDSTLLPAVLLVGHAIALLRGWWQTRAAALTLCAGALLAVAHVVRGYDGIGP